MEINELFESCKEFMINHISTVEVPNLPESERTYRIEHSKRVAKYAIQIAKMRVLIYRYAYWRLYCMM